MNMIRTALATLVLAVLLPAQAAPAQSEAAKGEYDKLVAAWQAEVQANREAVKKIQATDAFKQAQAAKDSAKVRELMASVSRPDGKAMGERALGLADQFGDDGLRFLTFAMTNAGDADIAKGIVERIGKNHLKNPQLAELLDRPTALLQASAGVVDDLLTRIAAENPSAEVKALAMYWHSVALSRGKPTAEQKEKADALLAKAETLATGDLADRIVAPRFQKERLQIGMEVPDIVGEDVDGVAFKLSDYRGKVVVLDFWGFW
jgi:hypothetical protein